MPSLVMPTFVRLELDGPGTTLTQRRSMPLASTELLLTDTTPTNPSALPTIATATNGARFDSPGVLLVTLDASSNAFVYAAIGPSPNPSAEPRHYLRDGSYLFEIGDKDRVSFVARAPGATP